MGLNGCCPKVAFCPSSIFALRWLVEFSRIMWRNSFEMSGGITLHLVAHDSAASSHRPGIRYVHGSP